LPSPFGLASWPFRLNGTLEIMRVLIAGRMARNENREVLLNEIQL